MSEQPNVSTGASQVGPSVASDGRTLKDYAQHDNDCDFGVCAICSGAEPYCRPHGHHDFESKPCTCGLDALLTAVSAPSASVQADKCDDAAKPEAGPMQDAQSLSGVQALGSSGSSLAEAIADIERLCDGARNCESSEKDHLMWLWRGKAIGYETVLGRLSRVSSSPHAGETPGWQPISSAPKDGTTIIGYPREGPARMRFLDGGWVDCETHTASPTHWLPDFSESDAMIAAVTKVVREADRAFQSGGGTSRHWVRDWFLPYLADAGVTLALPSPPKDSK